MTAPFATPAAESAVVPVRREEGWLLYAPSLPVRPIAFPKPETLLRWNAALGGAAKFVLSPTLAISLRAEVPVTADPEAPGSPLSATTADGLINAQGFWGADTEPQLPEVEWEAGELPPGLSEACAAAGWNATQTAGALAGALGEAGDPWQARLQPLPDGTIRIFAELCDFAEPSAPVRLALSRFLLLAGGLLRWARPVLRAPPPDGFAAGLEIVLPAHPTPELLADAFGALSIGCQRFGHEAAQFQSETVAREFMEITGG